MLNYFFLRNFDVLEMKNFFTISIIMEFLVKFFSPTI